MNFKITKPTIFLCLLVISAAMVLNSCKNSTGNEGKTNDGAVSSNTSFPNEVTPTFKHWNLILGDGSNVGVATKFQNKDYFYTASDKDGDWVVYKTPNGGNTHGTSNNTRTELAQLKKWSPMTTAKLDATLKVMNVSPTGDPSVASTHSVVVGQIHSADGHENEPLKIFYNCLLYTSPSPRDRG